MQKIFAFIGLVTVASLGAAVAKDLWRLWDENAKEAAMETAYKEGLRHGIDRIGATLPQRVDELTTVVAVGLDGKTYWQRSVIDAEDAQIREAKEDIRRGVTDEMCKKHELREMWKQGIVMQNQYLDRYRKPVMTVEISGRDCR